jgi:YEATS family
MTAHIFQSYSRLLRTEDDTNLYAWCVFLDGSAAEIESIRRIEYTLHPSFPDPVRVVDDAKHCFALQSQGWGVFQIRVRVFYRDGGTGRQGFSLKLDEDAWPRGPKASPGEFEDPVAQRVYDSLMDGDWDWRKVSTLVSHAGGNARELMSALESMEDQRLARRAPYQSLEGEEMWGATYRVRLLPELK